MLWQIVTAGNLLAALTYSVIAVSMAVRLYGTGQLSLRANPLGVAMTLVLTTVALRNAWSTIQQLLPELGVDYAPALALRDSYTLASLPLPFLAAAAGLLYLWLRRRAGDETGPASLYPDHALQRRRALEFNDNIVQGLLVARELDKLGRNDEARLILDGTLQQAQRMMGELLDGDVRPGSLRRTTHA